MESEDKKVRLDKWLWAARFFKTRALAIKAIKQGKVLMNHQKPNPSREVKVGAEITIQLGDIKKSVIVESIADKRQGATIAQALYQETEESLNDLQQVLATRQADKMLRTTAPRAPKRPEKKERRQMRAMRRQRDEN